MNSNNQFTGRRKKLLNGVRGNCDPMWSSPETACVVMNQETSRAGFTQRREDRAKAQRKNICGTAIPLLCLFARSLRLCVKKLRVSISFQPNRAKLPANTLNQFRRRWRYVVQ